RQPRSRRVWTRHRPCMGGRRNLSRHRESDGVDDLHLRRRRTAPVPDQMTTNATRTGRLSVDDWIQAALDIMASEGIGGVKIQRLCEHLGVTKGSFYWHFTDLDGFLDMVAEQWRRGEGTFDGQFDDVVRTDAKDGLSVAVNAFVDRRL